MKICVNCGTQAKDKRGNYVDESYDHQLYKKTGIMKLLECWHCNKIVDKYIEYDGCLILLDLALQCPSAYRHVIVNGGPGETMDRINTKLLLKLVFVTLIIDGFCKWQERNEKSNQEILDEFWGEKMEGVDFVHQEYKFYTQIGVSIVGLFAFVFTAMFIFMGNNMLRRLYTNYKVTSGWRLVLSGLMLTYCSRSLKLMALLWQSSDRSGFMWTSIDLLFFLTTITNLKYYIAYVFVTLQSHSVLSIYLLPMVFTKMNTLQTVLTAACANATIHFLECTNHKILQLN